MNILFPRNRFFRRVWVVLPTENTSISDDFSSAGNTNHELWFIPKSQGQITLRRIWLNFETQ